MRLRFSIYIAISTGFAFAAACTAGGSCGGIFDRKGSSEGGHYDGGDESCSVWADEICDTSAEGCDCVDCIDTAYCHFGKDGGFEPGLCDRLDQNDGICGPLIDYCVCGDCMTDLFCQDPGKVNCTADGVCDPYIEGCRCDDCKDKDFCKQSQNANMNCYGPAGGGGAGGEMPGEANGVCEEGESCDCVDCVGLPRCISCFDNGLCDVFEGCFCNDCRTSPICSDCAGKDNGLCDAVDEGCECPDCQGEKECGGMVGMGGAGGMGGIGGMGGAGGN